MKTATTRTSESYGAAGVPATRGLNTTSLHAKTPGPPCNAGPCSISFFYTSSFQGLGGRMSARPIALFIVTRILLASGVVQAETTFLNNSATMEAGAGTQFPTTLLIPY